MGKVTAILAELKLTGDKDVILIDARDEQQTLGIEGMNCGSVLRPPSS